MHDVKDKQHYLYALNMLAALTQFGTLFVYFGWVIHMFDVVLVYTLTTTSHKMDYMRQTLKQASMKTDFTVDLIW